MFAHEERPKVVLVHVYIFVEIQVVVLYELAGYEFIPRYWWYLI